MTTLEIILLTALVLTVLFVVGLVFFLLNKKKAPIEDTKDNSIDLLQKEIQSMRESIDKRMVENTKTVHDETKYQAEQSSRLIKDVTKELENIKSKSDEMLSFTSQLNNLEKVLSSQKQRGVLGEYLLDNVLSDIFPPNLYETQYKFTDGKQVDAILRIKDKIVPIDSKFSLENYKRYLDEEDKERKESAYKDLKADIKKRINETAEYIKPEESTTNFAFMFIPSESLYYNILTESIGNDSVLKYATDKKVTIVSPTTIVAYLQTVNEGLKGLEIEQKAKEIIGILQKINKKTVKSVESYDKLGRSLQATVNHFNETGKSIKTQNRELIRITGEGDIQEIAEVDKPLLE